MTSKLCVHKHSSLGFVHRPFVTMISLSTTPVFFCLFACLSESLVDIFLSHGVVGFQSRQFNIGLECARSPNQYGTRLGFPQQHCSLYKRLSNG